MKRILLFFLVVLALPVWGQNKRLQVLDPVDTNQVATRAYADGYDGSFYDLPNSKAGAIDRLGFFQSILNVDAIENAIMDSNIVLYNRFNNSYYRITADSIPGVAVDGFSQVKMFDGKYAIIEPIGDFFYFSQFERPGYTDDQIITQAFNYIEARAEKGQDKASGISSDTTTTKSNTLFIDLPVLVKNTVVIPHDARITGNSTNRHNNNRTYHNAIVIDINDPSKDAFVFGEDESGPGGYSRSQIHNLSFVVASPVNAVINAPYPLGNNIKNVTIRGGNNARKGIKINSSIFNNWSDIRIENCDTLFYIDQGVGTSLTVNAMTVNGGNVGVYIADSTSTRITFNDLYIEQCDSVSFLSGYGQDITINSFESESNDADTLFKIGYSQGGATPALMHDIFRLVGARFSDSPDIYISTDHVNNIRVDGVYISGSAGLGKEFKTTANTNLLSVNSIVSVNTQNDINLPLRGMLSEVNSTTRINATSISKNNVSLGDYTRGDNSHDGDQWLRSGNFIIANDESYSGFTLGGIEKELLKINSSDQIEIPNNNTALNLKNNSIYINPGSTKLGFGTSSPVSKWEFSSTPSIGDTIRYSNFRNLGNWTGLSSHTLQWYSGDGSLPGVVGEIKIAHQGTGNNSYVNGAMTFWTGNSSTGTSRVFMEQLRISPIGSIHLNRYGNSSSYTLSTLGKSKGSNPYIVLASDGTIGNESNIPSSDIASTGDSVTVQLEITGLDARLDALELDHTTGAATPTTDVAGQFNITHGLGVEPTHLDIGNKSATEYHFKYSCGSTTCTVTVTDGTGTNTVVPSTAISISWAAYR